jgi:ABC-type hemin transport system substrate-binding protein
MIGEEYRAEVEKPARKKGVAPVQQMLGLLLSVLLIWAVFSPPAGQGGPESAMPSAPEPRVASTSPAITESLVELGLGAHVVGRSGYCRSVPSTVPVVGDLRSFDAERLALARPSVLFVQPPLAGVDPALAEFCRARDITIVARPLDRLADLDGLAADIERVFAGVDAGGSPSWRARLSAIRATIAAAPAVDASAERVLVVVSADPFLAVGRGNYLDELLARAGSANAVDASGWVELSVEAMLALAPSRAVALAESREGALAVANALEVLPWRGTPPVIVAEAAPALLSPSFAALAQVAVLERLLSKDPAGAAERAHPGAEIPGAEIPRAGAPGHSVPEADDAREALP